MINLGLVLEDFNLLGLLFILSNCINIISFTFAGTMNLSSPSLHGNPGAEDLLATGQCDLRSSSSDYSPISICHVLLMFYVLSDLSVLRKNPGPDKSNKVIDLDLYHPFEATPVHQSQWDSSFTCLLQRTNLFDLDVLLLMGRIPKNGPKRHGCTMVFLIMHCVCGSVTRP